MSKSTVFEVKTDLPIKQFDDLANKLLGFEARYSRIKKQVQLLLQADELEQWSKQKHGKKLAVIDLLVDQYPLAIFHGDVGTGKTANAEAIVNRLARDARIEDALLFKLSNKVRGTGKVGEMGTLISQAFDELDNEREYYQEKRKETNDKLISRKGLIGKIVGFTPMVLLFVGYLIIPLVVIGFLSMTEAFSTMATSI